MTNLFTGNVDTNNLYESLATTSGVIFTSGSKYIIQIANPAYLREGDTGKGFLVNTDFPIQYTAGEDILYIRTPRPCYVNIAN